MLYDEQEEKYSERIGVKVMKNWLKRQRKNENGVVLITVLSIMTFATLLAAAAFTFVRTASERSYVNLNEKQSYYTASTCLENFIDSVLVPENGEWEDFLAVAQAGGTSDPITIDGMGTVTLKVEKPAGASYIKVTATAVNNDIEENVVCYLKATTEPGDAAFENAIELTSDSNSAYDNIHVMGDVAGSNDANSDMVYKFDNDSEIYGKYFQYGTIQNQNHLHFKSSVTGNGVSLTASKYIYFNKNEVYINSQIAKQNNNQSNFICAGNTFATNSTTIKVGVKSDSLDAATGLKANDIDLYAYGIVFGLNPASSSACDFSKTVANNFTNLAAVSTFEVGSDVDMPHYYQYGNVYCYANGGTNTAGKTDGELAGNLVCDSKAQVYIEGDVFVEGNLYIGSSAKLEITGNLYVKGDIYGTPVVQEDTLRTNTGYIYCDTYTGGSNVVTLDDTTFDGFKTARGAFPETSYQGTQFIYHAEDLLVSTDTNVSTISQKYKAVVTNKNSYSVSSYSGGTEDGVTFDKIITGSCYIKQNDLQNCSNILVKVTSDDIIIVFESGTNLNNGKKILVKNETKSYEDSDTNCPSFCYFTVDTYTSSATVSPVYKTDSSGNLVLDRNGNKIVIDSTHSGFTTNATLSMDNCIIGDFDTFKEANVGYSVNGVSCGTKALNLTGTDIPGTYNPGNGYIIMLLTEGTQIYAQNACQIEATVYGRQAGITYNATPPTVNYAIGNASSPMYEDKQTFAIGSLVLGTLDIGNNPWICYCPPSSRSNLANLGGLGADKVVGYEVLKYTQDLS